MLTKLFLLAFLATPSVWLTITPESSSSSVTLPPNSTVRWCNSDDTICSPNEVISAQTVMTPYCPSFAPCSADDATDGLQSVTKQLEILETSSVQMVVIDGRSITVPSVGPPAALSIPPGVVTGGTGAGTMTVLPPPTPILSSDGIVTATAGDGTLSILNLGSNTRSVSHLSFQVTNTVVAPDFPSAGPLLATLAFKKSAFLIGSCIVVQNGSASLGLGWKVDPVANSMTIFLPGTTQLSPNMTVAIHIDCYPFNN